MGKKKCGQAGRILALYCATAVIWTVLLGLRMRHLQDAGWPQLFLTILTAAIWWAAVLAQFFRWRREKRPSAGLPDKGDEPNHGV